MRKNKQAELLQEALKDIKSRWVLFKLLSSREWAWEFLKRNPDFLADSEKIEKKIDQEVEEYIRQFEGIEGLPLDSREFIKVRIEDNYSYSEEARKIVKKYGLLSWANPKNWRPPNALLWLEEINGKEFSDYFLEQSFDKKKRVIKNLKLTEDEDCLIINYNTPWQIYLKEIKKRYRERGKLENLKQFFLDRYPDYIKIYDLRNWKKDENGKPVLSWSTIRDYIAEDKEMSIQTVKKRYEAALRLIEGEYRELAKYSPASPNKKAWSLKIVSGKGVLVSNDGDVVDTGTLAERMLNSQK